MRKLFLVAAACGVVIGANAAELPFRLATSGEIVALDSPAVILTPLNQTDFKTAATVKVKRKTYAAISDTVRGNQTISKTYRQALDAGPDPGAQAVPPSIDPTEFVDYEDNLNSAQVWATMSETGTPFVMVYADGMSQGQAAASWSTKYVVPGTGNRDVYVQFKIPAVTLTGRWEDAAPSLTLGRVRVDFLVNAFPAWSTEAVRWNEQNEGNGDTIRVDTFGQSIGLEGHSFGSNMQSLSSTARVITVKLGTYLAGKALDLTLLYQVEGKGSSECMPSADEMDCGNVSIRVDWDTNYPQPKFFSKPAT